MRAHNDDYMPADIRESEPAQQHRVRLPHHMKAITIIALVCAILGIGGIIGSSHAAAKRQALASECSTQTDLMNDAYHALRDKINTAKESTDTSALSSHKSLAAQWQQATRLPPVPLIVCKAQLHNKELKANTQTAKQQREQYLTQTEKLEALEVRVANLSERTAKKAARERLSAVLADAHAMLERTENLELKVPYLRTRLSQLATQGQQTLDDRTSGATLLQDCAASLESMTRQVGESAGLVSEQQSDNQE